MLSRLVAADLLLVNGTIHLVDQQDRTASAIAIKDGRVLAVGGIDELRGLAGLGTLEEDLGGATVIPGLIDAHNHLLMTGRILQQVQLYDCRSIPEIVERVRRKASELPEGAWILGRGWDESLLAERRHPNRQDLDAAAPNHPVVLHRVWNKLACNSLAMKMAGISRETPDPPSDQLYAGSFDRDEHGEPTGLFRDRAKELVTRAVPEATEHELVGAIETACRAYNAVGLTGVAEPGLFPREIRAFHIAHQQRKLTVRTEMLIAAWGFGESGESDEEIKHRIRSTGVLGGFGDDVLRLEGVKFMPDGGVGDRTARMYDPYPGEPGNRGQWVVPPDQLASHIRWVHDMGWSIDTHTCGDEAQDVVVHAYAAAQSANPNPRLRHRVHHAYFPTDEALQLMARHRFSAVVSNPFVANLGESFVTSLGEQRAERAMPMRSYLDAGVPLAGSSDSAVSDFNPWVGMWAATCRETVAGRKLGLAQRISAKEALRSYTIGGAFATGQEGRRGSLEPGKLADLVVLERDPLEIDSAELKHVKPLATMMAGEWVFDRR